MMLRNGGLHCCCLRPAQLVGEAAVHFLEPTGDALSCFFARKAAERGLVRLEPRPELGGGGGRRRRAEAGGVGNKGDDGCRFALPLRSVFSSATVVIGGARSGFGTLLVGLGPAVLLANDVVFVNAFVVIVIDCCCCC